MCSKGTKDIELTKDLSGKVAIVTGPSLGGIGYFTAKAFAERGATVILAGRDQKKLDEAEAKIKEETSNKGTIIKQILDLTSLESVRTFAQQFQERALPLNYLINNAGIMATDFGHTTKDGFEVQIGTNHLGHFYLTKLLLPQLKAGAPSRVINLSSLGHNMANIHTADKLEELFYPTPKTYSRWGQYGNSKLANLLHAKVLNERYSKDGITAYAAHPGVVQTELGRHTWYNRFFYWVGGLFMKSPDQGASTTMYCALTDKALGEAGGYFADCAPHKMSKTAQDMAFAQAHYDYSDKLVTEWEAKRAAAKNEASSEEQKQPSAN